MVEKSAPALISPAGTPTIDHYSRTAAFRRLLLGLALVALSLIFGVGLARSAQNPLPLLGLAFFIILLPLLWYRPVLGVYALVAGAVTFEPYGLNFPDSLTDQVPFFKSFVSMGAPLPLPITPAELLMILTLAVVVLKRIAAREKPLELGPLFGAVAFFTLMGLVGFVHGISSGGELQSAIWEVRSQIYLFFTYLLVFNLIRERTQATRVMWIFLLAVAFKGLLGSWRFLVTLGGQLSTEAIFTHEESFFFALFFIFIFLTFIFGGDRRQLKFSLIFSLPVLLSLLANQRRAGTLVVLVGILVVLLMAYVLLPSRRKILLAFCLIGALILPFDVLVSGNSTTLWAQPARAIVSLFKPNARDEASNAYRVVEAQNLKQNIGLGNPLLGRGYGQPIVMFHPLPDLTHAFVFWDTIPHNTILWVWMRLGFVGFVAFWFLVGRAIVEASLVAKHSADPGLRSLAVFATAVIVGWVIMGAVDMGLVDLRLAILVAALVGLVPRLAQMSQKPQ